jgi:hypothetical protein
MNNVAALHASALSYTLGVPSIERPEPREAERKNCAQERHHLLSLLG